MNFMSKEQIDKIEEYASALLNPCEIAILLGLPPRERTQFTVRCRHHHGSPEYEAYQRGRLHTKLKLRRNIVKLAIAGSPSAEPLAEQFLQEQNME